MDLSDIRESVQIRANMITLQGDDIGIFAVFRSKLDDAPLVCVTMVLQEIDAPDTADGMGDLLISQQKVDVYEQERLDRLEIVADELPLKLLESFLDEIITQGEILPVEKGGIISTEPLAELEGKALAAAGATH